MFANARPCRGRSRRLGQGDWGSTGAGDLGVDTEIVIRKHHLPHEFSTEELQEAAERAHP